MALENIQAGAAEAPQPPSGFPAYLFAHGAWFLAFGVQVVLFPYLVRVVLQESEIRFGLAQMALQLPTTLLILVGGFAADRGDARKIVVAACGLAVLTFLTLGGLVTSGRLTYGLMIGYAVTVGVIGAFATPARDSLLSLVAPGTGSAAIQKAVAFASLAQFGAQILGMLLAAAAPFFGIGPLLLGQAGLMVLAAFAAASLRPRPAFRRERGAGGLLARMGSDIKGGLAAAAASPVIAPVVICATAMGVCFMGSFFVLLPLIVESYFVADIQTDPTRIASALGLFSLCFWSGSIISAMVLVRLGGLPRKGLIYLCALATGALVLIGCSIPMPFPALCVMNFIWGLGGGVAMTLGRGLVQEYAPEESRGRVLSIFTLGLMGGGPLGAVAYGFLAKALGAHTAILIPGLMMLVLVAAVFTFSKLKTVGDSHA